MARGDVREAASLLELATQRGRDASTLLRLATVRRSLGDLPGASAAAAAAVELAPNNFLMALLLGSLREATDADHAAERAYRVACAYMPRDLTFQPTVAKQLEHARNRVAVGEAWRQALLHWEPEDDVPGVSREELRRLIGFRSNILDNLDGGPLAPPLFLVPGVKSERYFETSAFPGVEEVATRTQVILDEFLSLEQNKAGLLSSSLNGLAGHDMTGSRIGRWSMIPLIRDGKPVEEFAWHCPQTLAAAQALDMPKLGLISPSLHFSILEPNSRIARHIGITNARVIVHFPLIVPSDCGFRVGGETRTWEVGRPMIFDDMTAHEAWNNSQQKRVVLIADLWRPSLTHKERKGIERLMNYPDFVRS